MSESNGDEGFELDEDVKKTLNELQNETAEQKAEAFNHLVQLGKR